MQCECQTTYFYIYLYITENWMYLRFWDTPILLKPHTGEHLPYSNFEIGKLNTPTNLSSFFKYCKKFHPLYKILDYNISIVYTHRFKIWHS